MKEGFGKLYNEAHELVAEGHCQVDSGRGSVTMHPVVDSPTIQRQQGQMRLALEDGEEIMLTDRVIRFRLNVPNLPTGAAYRLYFADRPILPSAEGSGV